jgi:hypothetical protein
LRKYKSAGIHQMLTELIQAGGKKLPFGIHKLINSVGVRENASTVEGVYYCTNLQEG